MRLVHTPIDREETPLGLLELNRYDSDDGQQGYEILLDGAFLMATHGAHSERLMAPLAHSALHGPERPLRVLVGGLGAGHTLRAALDLPNVAEVVVAELGARVVEWNRRYFAAANGGAVDDPRVDVRVGDLHELVVQSPTSWDLMLLDVDNGPGDLAAQENCRLYDVAGVRACRAALRPGGVLAVWSPHANPVFRAALDAVFPSVVAHDTAETGRTVDEPGDVIYVAHG